MYQIVQLFLLFLYLVTLIPSEAKATNDRTLWQIQSIDTMKSSRDLSREKLHDKEYEKEIDKQVKAIADTGATHIAIGTPYDPEFVPYLRTWVRSARKYDLSVWFRGNLSGWEGWFGYDHISEKEHTSLIKTFILEHPDLFQDGDIFTSCPECENGGPGDPRQTGNVIGFRHFLLNEYHEVNEAFKSIHKSVRANFYSMNGDVAMLVMDKKTTQRLGGIVVIDHYVTSPDQLAADIKTIAEKSNGKIVLGEFGVAIPDIHGNLSEKERTEWLHEALRQLTLEPGVIGLNYWVNVGGTTSLWNENMSKTSLVDVLSQFYSSNILKGIVVDEKGSPLPNVLVRTDGDGTTTNQKGQFVLTFPQDSKTITFSHMQYLSKEIPAQQNGQELRIVLKEANLWEKIWNYFKSMISFS